jgi:hypothetical protein
MRLKKKGNEIEKKGNEFNLLGSHLQLIVTFGHIKLFNARLLQRKRERKLASTTITKRKKWRNEKDIPIC